MNWETLPKVVENGRAKILKNLPIKTDKQVIANQPNIGSVKVVRID